MEITAEEMKKSIKRIYERLDKISPVDFDCGKLCGEVCCVYDKDKSDAEELVLYLLPGEELMYEDSPDFELYYMDSSEIKYPHYGKTPSILSNAPTHQNATGPSDPSNAEHFR